MFDSAKHMKTMCDDIHNHIKADQARQYPVTTTEVASQTGLAGEQRNDDRVGAEINNGLETKLRLRAEKYTVIECEAGICIIDNLAMLRADFA